jgi:hypothetical protein
MLSNFRRAALSIVADIRGYLKEYPMVAGCAAGAFALAVACNPEATLLSFGCLAGGAGLGITLQHYRTNRPTSNRKNDNSFPPGPFPGGDV